MKIKNIIMAFLLVVALLFVPNVFAAEDIEIKNITKAGKSDNATYCENPQVSGLSISFEGVTFKDQGDYVIYTLDVVNNSNEDYEISNGTTFSESKYFKYDFEFDGNSNIVAKKSTKKMKIKISYDKEVNPTAFNDDGTFREENNMTVNLVNKPTENPKTGSGIAIILIFAFLVAVGSIAVILNNKTKLNKEFIMILALTLAVVPLTVFAAKMVTIKLDTEIVIDKNYHFYIAYLNSPCGDSVLSNTFEAQSDYLVDYVDEMCVDEYWTEEYSYVRGDINWNTVKTEFNEGDNYLSKVYTDKNKTTNVKGTDRLINGKTYYYYSNMVAPQSD